MSIRPRRRFEVQALRVGYRGAIEDFRGYTWPSLVQSLGSEPADGGQAGGDAEVINMGVGAVRFNVEWMQVLSQGR